jgi:uncharacterized C2H2 Zn-finger protein
MAFVCLCGSQFAGLDPLHQHADVCGHRLKCPCDKLFKDHEHLDKHWGKAHAGLPDPEQHPLLKGLPVHPGAGKAVEAQESSENVCGVCKASLRDAGRLRYHLLSKHHACPKCSQTFDTKEARNGHQRAARHLYCPEHDKIFKTYEELRSHKKKVLHVTGFACLICNREFNTQQGLNDHLNDKDHPGDATTTNDDVKLEALKATIEKANLHCDACDQSFKNLIAFNQHKASVKHHPLSDLRCPLSADCDKVFTSPSALILHIETGGCQSGMDRLQLNAIVHKHDTERHITYEKYAADAIAAGAGVAGLLSGMGSLSLASNSSQSGVILTPDESNSSSITSTTNGGGVILTPSASCSGSRTSSVSGGAILTSSATQSLASTIVGNIKPTPSVTTTNKGSTTSDATILTPTTSSQGLTQWSYVLDTVNATPKTTSVASSYSADTITEANPTGIFICEACNAQFRKMQSLLDHLNSPVHALKMFHCPTAVLGEHAKGKGTKAFKTLSGMAQHIETGACSDGKETLDQIVGIFEQKVKESTGVAVKLLRSGID